MEAAHVHDVLSRLADVGVIATLDGGWGVDALLARQTRPHRDVDLVIDRTDLSRAEQSLAALGLAPDAAARPGLPARQVLAADDGRSVDLHLITRDGSGTGWQELDEGAWGRYPAEGLTGTGIVAGSWVRCITADLQLQHHLGYPPQPHDLADVRALAAHFGLPIPPGWTGP
jgi:lincosamide nucleotidyltransferase A/C/D/E